MKLLPIKNSWFVSFSRSLSISLWQTSSIPRKPRSKKITAESFGFYDHKYYQSLFTNFMNKVCRSGNVSKISSAKLRQHFLLSYLLHFLALKIAVAYRIRSPSKPVQHRIYISISNYSNCSNVSDMVVGLCLYSISKSIEVQQNWFQFQLDSLAKCLITIDKKSLETNTGTCSFWCFLSTRWISRWLKIFCFSHRRLQNLLKKVFNNTEDGSQWIF